MLYQCDKLTKGGTFSNSFFSLVTKCVICMWRLLQMLKSVLTEFFFVSVCKCVCCSAPGKIISIETSALRATGRPGWEDLVRKCIYAFFQPQGKEPSHAKKLLHEGESPAVDCSTSLLEIIDTLSASFVMVTRVSATTSIPYQQVELNATFQ